MLESDGTDEYLWVLLAEWLKSLPLTQLHKMGLVAVEELKELKRKRRKMRRLRVRIAELEDEIAERRITIYGSN